MMKNEWGEVFGLLSDEEAEQLERVLRWIEDAMREQGEEVGWTLKKRNPGEEEG